MVTVFSSTGCIRCRIVKQFLDDSEIPFTEHDVKTEEGSAAFRSFYRVHRLEIRRDTEGIFFPIVTDGETISQDVGPSLARFMDGDGLLSCIFPNNLGHGWSGGLFPDSCPPELEKKFLLVMRRMKDGGLQTEIESSGKNASLLHAIIEENLADRIIFCLWGNHMGIPGVDDPRLNTLKKVAEYQGGKLILRIDTTWYAEENIPLSDLAALLEKSAEVARSALGNIRPECLIRCSSDIKINLLPLRTAVRRWIPNAEIEK